MEYRKNFDAWNMRKTKIDSETTTDLYIKEREVWWLSLGVNVGHEIDGKNDLFERPVLIFRKAGREQFYGLPITSQDRTGAFYRLVRYEQSKGMVCLSQLRVLSTKRLLRKIGIVQKEDFTEIQNAMARFFLGGRL